MADREKVIKALDCCVFPVSKGFPYQSHIADKGCEVVECPYRDDCDQMLLDALELLKEQRPNCESAEHDATGCLGYQHSEFDDEPIEACMMCEKYTGNRSEEREMSQDADVAD